MTISDSPERKAKLEELKEQYTSEDLLSWVLAALSDKQGNALICAEIAGISSIADYVVLASATSSTHLKVLAEHVKFHTRKQGFEMLNPGQSQDANWMLLDFGSVIVHVMSMDWRERYKLEDLWTEGVNIDVEAWLQEHPCDFSS